MTRVRPPFRGPATTRGCKALDIAEPDDIVVGNAGGDLTNAIIGKLMLAHAEAHGLGGIAIHGAIRDFSAIAEGVFPIYAADETHGGPCKDGPGEINVPVSFDGMVVSPDDLVLGDEDGLLAVPLHEAHAILEVTRPGHAAGERQMAAIRAGRNDQAWVDTTLKRVGVI